MTGISAWTIAALLAVLFTSTNRVDADMLRSPNGKIQATIVLPHWSLAFQGRVILADSLLKLEAGGEGDLLAGAAIVARKETSHDERIPVLWGKSATAANRYRELRLQLRNTKGRRIDLVFRCFDDAFAFRYEIPAQPGIEQITIADEGTTFAVAGNPAAHPQYPKDFKTSHEHNVATSTYHDLKRDALMDTPLTLQWEGGVSAAITEAAIRKYPGMYLKRPAVGSDDLVCTLAPRPDGTKAVRTLPMETPWRVVLVGDRLGALLESNAIYCLNDPPAFKDTSWIQPGKVTWNWWNGYALWPEKPGPILSLASVKEYIDWCAQNGIPYNSVIASEEDTPWYVQSQKGIFPGPDTDPSKPRAGFDMEGMRQYASSKGVKLWTWVHQAALKGRVEECFAAFEKMGWAGMMVDFFDHDDQDTVEYAEEILQAAARHHIMLHFHGVWKIGGWQRTYPNLVNHEGALNLEYLKWGEACPPEHTLKMVFTRMLSGPMDYHLGGFRAVPRSKFKPEYIKPVVLGTRGHMLACYVCIDNPMQMVADYPGAYQNQPGFDFLREVPTWWDETRVLAGEVGRLLVTARRKGSTWWIGGLAAGESRDVTLPLSFLGKGNYTARIWRDGARAAEDPNQLEIETKRVVAADTLRVRVAADGGFVMKLDGEQVPKRLGGRGGPLARDAAVVSVARSLMGQIYAGKVDSALLMASVRPQFEAGKLAAMRSELRSYGPVKSVKLVERKAVDGKDAATLKVMVGETAFILTLTVTAENRVERFLLIEE